MKSLFAGTKHQRAFGAKIPVRYHPVVVINADAQAPHQSVIGVMEAARIAGLPRIAFAAQKPAP